MRRLMFSLFTKVYRLLRDKGLGKVPGVLWAYYFLFRRLRPRGLVLTRREGNKLYINADDRNSVLGYLVNSGYERWETELFKGMITEGMTVVDIGAHIGYYALIAAKLVGSSGTVYAFEPLADNWRLLVKNIEINGYTNVIPVNKAVSNKCGIVKLFLDRVDTGASSFSQGNVFEKADSVEVETVALSEFFQHQRMDFIKMDVQGAEGLILDGAREILRQDGLKIMMEFWPVALKHLGTEPLELLNELQDIGFKIELIDRTPRCLQPAQVMEIIHLRAEQLGEHSWGAQVNLLLER